MPKILYKGHTENIAVNKGMMPITPHQLLRTTPKTMIIASPIIILAILSMFPTFDFMIFVLYCCY